MVAHMIRLPNFDGRTLNDVAARVEDLAREGERQNCATTFQPVFILMFISCPGNTRASRLED